jgi:hypothetical protein
MFLLSHSNKTTTAKTFYYLYRENNNTYIEKEMFLHESLSIQRHLLIYLFLAKTKKGPKPLF